MSNRLRRQRRGRALWCTILLSAALVGCGTTLNQFFFQSAMAAGRTYADLLFTSGANQIANTINPVETADTGGGTEEDAFAGLTGNAADGQTSFAANNCATCHCSDASGQCALNAPRLIGVSAETLDAALRGDSAHSGGAFNLTDQGIVDLEAYLASP